MSMITEMDCYLEDMPLPGHMRQTTSSDAKFERPKLPLKEVVIESDADGNYQFDFSAILGEQDERISLVCQYEPLIRFIEDKLRNGVSYLLECGVIKYDEESILIGYRVGESGEVLTVLEFDVHKDLWDAACKEKRIDFDWMDPNAIKES